MAPPKATAIGAGPDENMRAYVKLNLFEFICFLFFSSFSSSFEYYGRCSFFFSRSLVSKFFFIYMNVTVRVSLFLSSALTPFPLVFYCLRAHTPSIYSHVYLTTLLLCSVLFRSVLFQYFIHICVLCNSFHFYKFHLYILYFFRA